jgi:hypothetical protein
MAAVFCFSLDPFSSFLPLLFQNRIESRKRIVSGNCGPFAAGERIIRPVGDRMPVMLIVMTINAQQLPVAAIGWVVVVIVILVVDGELAKPFAFKLAPAAAANGRKHFKCPLAIALHPLLLLTPELHYELTIAIARFV